jgi:hypothetical protein
MFVLSENIYIISSLNPKKGLIEKKNLPFIMFYIIGNQSLTAELCTWSANVHPLVCSELTLTISLYKSIRLIQATLNPELWNFPLHPLILELQIPVQLPAQRIILVQCLLPLLSHTIRLLQLTPEPVEL